ncbi:MAG: phosphatidylserine decarboxylase family protein [Chloroflexi bacterium]|nr:phosphatidylserine decarboxylase family protein [Chloroflexota bacterium]
MTRIHPEGYPFIAGAGLAAVTLRLLGQRRAAQGALAVALAAAYFFRDPDRHPPAGEDTILAPADGRILTVRRTHEPLWIQGDAWQVGTFMSIFDVHINRAPCTGKVVRIEHKPGTFLPADRDEALHNERRLYYWECTNGQRLLVIQIAGLLARRTVPFVVEGQEVVRGQRFGLIRFGSRVEVYMPTATSRPLVLPGHRVRAGETPIGLWVSTP